MCVISFLLKFAISIVNSLLMIMGIVLFVIGALLLWGMNYFLKYIYDLQTQIQNLIIKLGIKADASGVISLVQQNASSIGIIAFIAGCILIALSVIGIVAVFCCTLKLILIVICIFLICFTLALIGVVAYYGSNSTDRILVPLTNTIQNDIISKYRDMNSTEPQSMLINVIQITANCCGVYNYTDYNNATNFYRQATASDNKNYPIIFPLSCCDYKQDFTIDMASRDSCIKTQTSSKMNMGCYTRLEPNLKEYLGYCFTTIGITIGILVAAIIVTIILIKCAAKLE